MSDSPSMRSRRDALRCLAYGGAGTLFTLAGGIFTPIDLALAATSGSTQAKSGDEPGKGNPRRRLGGGSSDLHPRL